MPLVEITALSDPRLDPFRELKRTNATRWAEQFVAEGDKLTRRLLAARRFEIVSLLVGRRYARTFAELAPPEIPILVVDDRDIEEIIGFNFHRGVLACAKRPAAQHLAEALAAPAERSVIVVCPNLHDPENLGTLVRTSLALGVAALVLGPHCADPFSRRVLRTSMGAAFELPIYCSADLAADVQTLRRSGFRLVASVVDSDAESILRFEPPPRLALFIGNEAHGLEPEWIERCDERITIPMRPGPDSLNAAVAAGILLHHVTRALRI